MKRYCDLSFLSLVESITRQFERVPNLQIANFAITQFLKMNYSSSLYLLDPLILVCAILFLYYFWKGKDYITCKEYKGYQTQNCLTEQSKETIWRPKKSNINLSIELWFNFLLSYQSLNCPKKHSHILWKNPHLAVRNWKFCFLLSKSHLASSVNFNWHLLLHFVLVRSKFTIIYNIKYLLNKFLVITIT